MTLIFWCQGMTVYGTNGFHLDFADNSSASALGQDVSGNGNSWTTNNFGTTDRMIDAPVNNFPVLTTILKPSGAGLSNGNLKVQNVGINVHSIAQATMALPFSGKWYWEVTPDVSSVGSPHFGIMDPAYVPYPMARQAGAASAVLGFAPNEYSYSANGNKQSNGVSIAYGAAFTTGDVIGIAVDRDAGTITFYKNGISQGIAYSGLSNTQVFMPAVGVVHAPPFTAATINFGQAAQPCVAFDPVSGGYFKYLPPNGFKALCTNNLPASVIIKGSDYFAPSAYTGNGASTTLTSLSFQPDLVLLKDRTSANNWGWFDAVRGATKYLSGNTSTAETVDATSLTAFNSNGFALGNNAAFNTNLSNYISYNWKTDNAFGSTNTNGSISSLVSANTTSAVSIVSYTGNGANATIGHGLSTAPKLIIIKDRTGTNSWAVYHNKMGVSPENGYLLLNNPGAFANNATYWNSTVPSASVFSIGINANVNAAGNNYIAYLFSDVEGFSKFDAYTGNGSADGPFVWTGFKPSYLLIKRANAAADWYIWDTGRDTYNVASKGLLANLSNSESNSASLDINSNGFKIRSATANFNAAGATYIYIAFAKVPFKYVNGGNTGSSCINSISNPPHQQLSSCDSVQVNGNWYYSSQIVTDTLSSSQGCDSIVFTDITIPLKIDTVIVSSQTNVSCFGGSNGSATVSVNGGTLPYTYLWSPSGGTNATANGLSAGIYTIAVSDSSMCDTLLQTVHILAPDSIAINTVITNVSCKDGNNGAATASAIGGIYPYAYSWSTGSTVATASNLSANTYTITVTDSNNCTSTQALIIAEPALLSVDILSASDVSCFGGNNGAAAALATGGVSPYTYSWSSGSTISTANNLSMETYTVTVTDSNNCNASQTVIINQPSVLSTTTSYVAAICTSASGSAITQPTGGILPYTYIWSSGDTLELADSLTAGTYTVTITDSNSCVKTDSVLVTSINPLTLSSSSSASSCVINNGSATVITFSGTAPYTYVWETTPPQTTQTATGLAAGNYVVTVTDSNGCIQSETATVLQFQGPTAAIAAVSTTITSGNSTQLIAAGNGTYSWTPPAGLSCTNCQNPVATPTETTTYCVAVTDTNSCSDTACIAINVEIPCSKLETPTAFSPNNDGHNDVFLLQGLGNCISSFSLMIFDRWGEKVFETENVSNSWDGTYKGKLLNSAVFVFYINATLTNGEKISKKGNISLIR